MAKQLIKDMTADWSANDFRDSFHDAIMQLVESKANSGQVEQVEKVESDGGDSGSGKVIDLTELLKRSLAGGSRTAPAAKRTAPPKKVPTKKAPQKLKRAA